MTTSALSPRSAIIANLEHYLQVEPNPQEAKELMKSLSGVQLTEQQRDKIADIVIRCFTGGL